MLNTLKASEHVSQWAEPEDWGIEEDEAEHVGVEDDTMLESIRSRRGDVTASLFADVSDNEKAGTREFL